MYSLATAHCTSVQTNHNPASTSISITTITSNSNNSVQAYDQAAMNYVAYRIIPAAKEEDQILPFPEQPSYAATWVKEIAEKRFLPSSCGKRKVGKKLYFSRQSFESLFGKDQACPVDCNIKLMIDGVMQQELYACSWQKGATTYYIVKAPMTELRGNWLLGAQWRMHQGMRVLVLALETRML